MFGKFTKLAEKVTKKDLDGDGDVADGDKSGVNARDIKDCAGDVAEKVADHHKERSRGTNPVTGKEDPDIPLSACDGNKRALFVGINYVGQKGELRGCHNDVTNLLSFVKEQYGFEDSNVRILMDDGSHDAPTRANMIAGMKWLKEGAKNGDSLLFHYSGHGGTSKDTAPDTDEADQQDETLIPVDYKESGVIVDDELHDILVKGLPAGVRLTALMDCCHSGSVFDLPYSYKIDGDLVTVQEIDNRKAVMDACIAAGVAYFSGDKDKALKKGMEGAMIGGKALLKSKFGIGGGAGNVDNEAQKRAIQIKSTIADVLQLSGCRDEQTSADAVIGGQATGAMSWAFKKSLKENPNQTYTELLASMRKLLEKKYTQVPMLSAGRHLDVKNAKFIM